MRTVLSIIFVHYNTPLELASAIKSIKEQKIPFPYEIIVVDNCSSKSRQFHSKTNIRIIRSKINLGYGAAINLGTKVSKGTYLLVSNCDVIFLRNSINKLLQRIQGDKKIGIITPQVLDSNKKILRTVSETPFLPKALILFTFLSKVWPFTNVNKNYHLMSFSLKQEKFVPAVGGVCMLIKKEVFEKIKGFDKTFFLYFEEADFCYRTTRAGYKVLYHPQSQIIHFVGRSSSNKKFLEKTFESTRFKFFKKYHGLFLALIGEMFIRAISATNIIVMAIISISLFINLHKINPDMMFFGDFGRDYLAARDMILDKSIPLVGIPSSVKWLHQGPLSIYLIGLSFLVGKFNPVAPAILYGTIGVFTTYLVYILGTTYFNKRVGILSSLFYATSPYVIVNTRMPYHTSLIPFFTCMFFIQLHKTLTSERKNFFLLFFLLGLLIEVELSNFIVFFILLVLWFLLFQKFELRAGVLSLLGFLFGILPLFLYDITHGFLLLFGFPLWVINRIRLFFGITLNHNSTTAQLPYALNIIKQQAVGVIFPWSLIVSVTFLTFGFIIFLRNFIKSKNKTSFLIILLWIIVPLFGFIVHATPGPAYFPFLYPVLILMIGFLFYQFIEKNKFFLLIFFLLIFYNGFFTIQNEYFLSSFGTKRSLPPDSYSIGYNLEVLEQAASAIVSDSENEYVQIKAGGSISQFDTAVDNFKYLVWYMGGNLDNKSKKTYTIYQDKKEVSKNKNIFYLNTAYYVVKDED